MSQTKKASLPNYCNFLGGDLSDVQNVFRIGKLHEIKSDSFLPMFIDGLVLKAFDCEKIVTNASLQQTFSWWNLSISRESSTNEREIKMKLLEKPYEVISLGVERNKL